MAVDFWADKYWNGQYFNVQYFGTGEQVEGAISGSAAGSSTATGTLTNGAQTAEIVLGGAWLPVIYVHDKKKRKKVETEIKAAVAVAVDQREKITAAFRREIARDIVEKNQYLGLKIGELEQFAKAVETQIAADRKRRNNNALAVLLMAA